MLFFIFYSLHPHPLSTLFPYTTLFRSAHPNIQIRQFHLVVDLILEEGRVAGVLILEPDGNLRKLPASLVCLRLEEHTSELQSPCNLVCRLLPAKKNITAIQNQAKSLGD